MNQVDFNSLVFQPAGGRGVVGDEVGRGSIVDHYFQRRDTLPDQVCPRRRRPGERQGFVLRGRGIRTCPAANRHHGRIPGVQQGLDAGSRRAKSRAAVGERDEDRCGHGRPLVFGLCRRDVTGREQEKSSGDVDGFVHEISNQKKRYPALLIGIRISQSATRCAG